MDRAEAEIPGVPPGAQASSLIARVPSPHDNARVDPKALAYLVGSPGLSRLRWAHKYALPPVERLTGINLNDFASGSAGYSMPVSGWLEWEEGAVPEGVLAILADSAHTGAVLSTAGPATGFLTAELSVQFCERVHVGAGRLEAYGKVLSADGEHMLSQVEISDSKGNLACVSTARSSLLPLPSSLRESPDHTVLSRLEDAEAGLQPFRFQVEGQGLPAPATASNSGREFLQSIAGGGTRRPPLKHFIGITPLAAGEGTCTFAVAADPWLCSHSGGIQGGVTGLVMERAAWGAVLAGLAAGESCRTLDIKVNYFHQMTQGSGILKAVGEVIHRSRRISVASVRAEDEDGRSLARAMATVGVTRAAR